MCKMKKVLIFLLLMIVFTCGCTACEMPTFSMSGLLPTYTCTTCKDKKEVKCASCNGKKEVSCSLCGGDGQKACLLCAGMGSRSCTFCGGLGSKFTMEYDFFTGGYKSVFRPCSSCVAGRVICPATTICGCVDGKNACYTCSGEGTTTCPDCKGN